MKKFDELVNKTVKDIIDNVPRATYSLSRYIKDNKWPVRYSKEQLIKTFQAIIDEKYPPDPSNVMVDLLLMRTTKMKSTTEKQKSLFRKVIDIVTNAPVSTCNHTNLGISIFTSGGGFTPVMANPEVICLDCGLNVTLPTWMGLKELCSNFGIQSTLEKMKELMVWVADSYRSGGIFWVDDVPKDPIGQYNKAKYKWDKEIPFSIVDMKLFESRTGA